MSKKIINVTVHGGCVDVSNIPTGVNVVLRDYDIESYDWNDKRIRKEKDGTRYIRRVFGR